MSILIKNARIITADSDFYGDIFIVGETIHTIGKALQVSADNTIDASGKIVFPGGIDPHVHLQMPFMGTWSSDSYETGTLAALHGGTTMIIDFILQTQGKSLQDALDAWRGRSDGNCYGDYSFHMAVTDFNENTRREIANMVAEGITSFKTFMAYKGALMIDDGQMIELMFEVKQQGGMVTVHATNGDMIDRLIAKHQREGKLTPLYHWLSQPEITEAEAAGRFSDMADYTGVPSYIVHLTCEGALNAVRNASRRNQKVFIETCIQYLILDAALYEREDGAKWVMSPPLRQKKDQETLWAGINQGLVQIVATDHCPFHWQQKMMGKDDFSKIPNGHPAIENRMELLWTEGVVSGKISPNKYVEVTSTNPARIFGMYPKKGCIAPGSDADLVIFAPDIKHEISSTTHHMNVDYSAYEGWQLQGKCEKVLLRGKIAIDNGKVLIDKGFGKFVRRNKLSKTI
jgi:dihydropyrimidinase